MSTAVCGKGLLSILSILEKAPVRHKIGVFSRNGPEGSKGLECIMINDAARSVDSSRDFRGLTTPDS